MRSISDAVRETAIGLTAIAIVSTVFLPRKNQTVAVMESLGKSQAAMLRAMMPKIRCNKSIMWPSKSGSKWYVLECCVYGDHELHVDEYGMVFRDEDIRWMKWQYELTTTRGM